MNFSSTEVSMLWLVFKLEIIFIEWYIYKTILNSSFVSSDELWRSRKGVNTLLDLIIFQMILIIISSSSSSSSSRRRRRRRL